MDLKEIKTIIELMKRNDLALFQLEREDFKIKLQRGTAGAVVVSATPSLTSATGGEGEALSPASGGGTLPMPAAAATPPPVTVTPPSEPLREIVSPMVGTFYQSPSPEAGPFVRVGQQVDEETVVCIIEAMKVMNEIKAEARGVIAEIVAENGKPVQFGQAMFRLR